MNGVDIGKAGLPVIRRAQPHLGTIVEISLYGATHQQVFDRAFARIAALEVALSFHRPSSELSFLNAALPGQEINLSSYFARVLELSRRIFRKSKGVFDVVRPESLAVDASFADVEFVTPTTVRKKKQLVLDLGGIAKGFIVDEAVAVLHDTGVCAGVVNAGGDVRVFGEYAQPVFLRDPVSTTHFRGPLQLKNQAMATSANYFRAGGQGCIGDPGIWSRGNKDYWRGADSVSVIAPSAAVADALTKVVMLDPMGAPAVLAHFGAHGVLVEPGSTGQHTTA